MNLGPQDDRPPLRACAARAAASPGRRHPEPPSRYRNEFQRDRDRIIHSTAFRRLEYKTQVFVNHEGDLYRTRLTHSLEVAQIGRTAARALHINEDLTEAVCLAHDLGHTPFGHAGQHALNDCMRGYGGFEHNLQSLRVVDELEHKYPAFTGLNLMFETREGILKHCSVPNARRLGDVGERFLRKRRPGLEAQLANLADEIAYNNHDVDDGLRSALIDETGLCEVELFGRHHAAAVRDHAGLTGRVLVYETVRRMIGAVVEDLVVTSGERLADAAPTDMDAVRAHPERLIAFSDEIGARHRELKRYLLDHLYRHPTVLEMTTRADSVIRALFAAYMDDPSQMSADFAAPAAQTDGAQTARLVADYVAGMTDRYALAEYRRLNGTA